MPYFRNRDDIPGDASDHPEVQTIDSILRNNHIFDDNNYSGLN